MERGLRLINRSLGAVVLLGAAYVLKHLSGQSSTQSDSTPAMAPKALSEDEKALKAYERAVNTAKTALEKVTSLHAAAKVESGLSACQLCFQNWPCETHKFAEGALNKMKGQLPR